jgi:hypothetical protein
MLSLFDSELFPVCVGGFLRRFSWLELRSWQFARSVAARGWQAQKARKVRVVPVFHRSGRTWLTATWRLDTLSILVDSEAAMESGANPGNQRSVASDSELLRRIGHDLRSLYAEVIRQPLPRNIEVALSRIEREHSRTGYQTQRLAVWTLRWVG